MEEEMQEILDAMEEPEDAIQDIEAEAESIEAEAKEIERKVTGSSPSRRPSPTLSTLSIIEPAPATPIPTPAPKAPPVKPVITIGADGKPRVGPPA
mmetsp:Transcript_30133/g.37241  ORF Transcript_30133/g.37241 Transcript_30133/m.37241 type:complete len:96 (-) Transcript_30133:1027-1314(-)